MSRSSGRRRALRYAAGLLVFAFLAVTVARGWSAVEDYAWQLDAAWVVAGIAVLFLYLLASAWAYGVIVVRLVPDLPLRRQALLAVWAKSMLGRYVPGNVMMVAGRLELGAELGLPRRVSLAASVYEQVLILGVSAAAGLVFLIAYGDPGERALLWTTALIPIGLAGLHPRIFRPLSGTLLRRFGREPLTVFLSGRQIAGMLAWYVGVVAVQGVAAWLLIRAATGPHIGGPVFVGLAFALAFTVAMVAFIFPSGLGVRDGLFALALAVRLPNPVAIAVAVAFRLVGTLAEVTFAVGLTALERRRRRKGATVTASSEKTPIPPGAQAP
jgi:hypothetical protein